MRGYHKPIMLAGGYGNIKRNLIEKNAIKKGDLLIVLGGLAMQIGLAAARHRQSIAVSWMKV